jgi:hypothetical protein
MDNGEPKMGEMITDIGMDMDGVVYPFVHAFKNYCAERQGKLFLPDPTTWHFYEDWDMDEKTFHEWVEDAATNYEVFSSQKPYAGVTDAWSELRAMGIKIHVLTARPQAAWEQTAKWLTSQGLVADSLHFNPTKGFLTKIAKGQALIIDDHVQYYDEAEKNNIIPVLMTRAWNTHKEDATRVNNLSELVSLIRGYNLVKKTEKTTMSKKLATYYKEEKPSPYMRKVYERYPVEPHKKPEPIWTYPTKDDGVWRN